MSSYAPGSTARGSTAAPAISPGYAVLNAFGRWMWSTISPADGGAVTNAQGRGQVDTEEESTLTVLLSSTGSPIILT